ncbi:MAG: SdpI family protein, partial [Spirochaetaceae bacterium]|nr:SdpI family protein [Spirochaetaceae bacterium]
MKHTKLNIILSCIVLLSPMIFGLIVWNNLPESMPIHWGIHGEVDRWSSKTFAVFVLPLIILAIHGICIFASRKDFRNKKQSPKVMGLVLWICPLLSVMANSLTYAISLGKEINVLFVVSLTMGALFVLIGNYLPKCQQNRIVGIRLKWTLGNEANWNATHRFAGKVWVIGGLLLMASSLLPYSILPWAMITLLIVFTSLPILYSYRFYKKG